MPNLGGSLVAYAFNVVRGTGPRPFLPLLDVAMMHWIVMNVVYAGPKMAMGFYSAIYAIVPDLTPAAIVFPIPFERCPAMNSSQFSAELAKAIRLCQ